ncbi:MAG: cadherin-like domain-containing protein, partial [Planctomycetes bacterium]|nr:cadherin-like domain-containing protein [Planctomycetota bacterium]
GPLSAINTALADVYYAPDPDFVGSDTLAVQVDDLGNTGVSPNGTTDSADVTLNVAGPPPKVNDDPNQNVNEDSEIMIDVLENDDPGTPSLTMNPGSVTVEAGPANGTATPLQSGSIRYKPNPNYFGSDQFTYRACNSIGKCDTAVVSITVAAVNDAPTIDPIANVTMIEGTQRTVTVTVNDVDNANGNLTVTAVSDQPWLTPGTPTGTGSERQLTLAPDDNEIGIANVTVTVSDGDKSSSTTFRVTVTAPDLTIRSISDGGASVRSGNTVI